MSTSRSSKLHVAMFPWFAFGHFTPFLHLSNKLAERGHRVSFLLPKGAQAKLQHLNHYPNLINFSPLLVPHVDSLPPSAETALDVPFSLHMQLAIAFDRTQNQVETILTTLKPHFIFFDFCYWLPALAHQLGTKAIAYSVVSAATIAFIMVPAKKMEKDMTNEELIQPPSGYPSFSVGLKYKEFEIATVKILAGDHGTGVPMYFRITSSIKESDKVAFRTYHEVEGPYCDYLRQQYAKLVLLTGTILTKTPETKLDEKWTKWLCNFEQGTGVLESKYTTKGPVSRVAFGIRAMWAAIFGGSKYSRWMCNN